MPTSVTPSGIAYDRGGPVGATPVVLLHAGVADRRMWDPQWAGLTAVRDAVRLDLRGFGASGLPPPAGALDPVADVLDTLDHLGVCACHVVASSVGSGDGSAVGLSDVLGLGVGLVPSSSVQPVSTVSRIAVDAPTRATSLHALDRRAGGTVSRAAIGTSFSVRTSPVQSTCERGVDRVVQGRHRAGENSPWSNLT